MTIVHFVLDLYFAATLGVSGIAKVESPRSFAATLRQQGILPRQAIGSVSRVLPWAEIVLACALVAGLAPVPVASVVLALFVGFFAVETFLLITGRTADCGCYGNTRRQLVDGASLMTSAALVVLATTHT